MNDFRRATLFCDDLFVRLISSKQQDSGMNRRITNKIMRLYNKHYFSLSLVTLLDCDAK